MKAIDLDAIDSLPGRRLEKGETFRFACHPQVSCFNLCCRNLNLFLYPYDVVRLKKNLGMTSGAFIDTHTDVVLREGNAFPEVLLKMADNAEQTCPFLTDAGCSVYPDRPDACRSFPVEQGAIIRDDGTAELLHWFKPPSFCRGQDETTEQTLDAWIADQGAETYHNMTRKWAAVKSLFQTSPWGAEGPAGNRAKMAFMAAYNVDTFREFVFGSSFLKRVKVKNDRIRKIRGDDAALMQFGFEWIRVFIWGMGSQMIKQKK